MADEMRGISLEGSATGAQEAAGPSQAVLENGVLRVVVSALGAELQSVQRADTGLEYLWQGDPATWSRRAPMLFPIVGRLRGDRYVWQGREYHLPQHGFARDRLFSVVAQDRLSASFELHDDEASRAAYPFAFQLRITYRLDGDALASVYEVTNPGPGELLFSLGAHPGFRCPRVPEERFEDYHLDFGHEETAARWPVEDGLTGTPSQPLLDRQRNLCLSRPLFARGALVLKSLHSTTVRLGSQSSRHGVDLSFEGFPFFGVWTKSPGDFVCLEPWCGIADPVAATGRLEEKEGIHRLAEGATWRRVLVIRVS